MKNYLLIVFACSVFIACNNKADQPDAEEDSTSISEYTFSWQAVLNDSTGKLELTKQEMIGPDSLSPQAVVDFLNSSNPNIALTLIKTSGDTIFIKITDATYLTQQMGSTGPSMYFASAVYNLTEIPGIRFANFDFEEGDHAQPGTFTRESFKDQ
ncbi:hypothetical protein CAP36_09350 [Chitinophagaceae bacterium IBVUCB2]|nr:hypothetical protein CAP36_09350 [Chitinophagaceae bacterium IBVUCB2]